MLYTVPVPVPAPALVLAVHGQLSVLARVRPTVCGRIVSVVIEI